LRKEYGSLTKNVKKALKTYRFEMLEGRIEVISRLKEWEEQQRSTVSSARREEGPDAGCSAGEHHRDRDDILETINQILTIC
jgi:hypothetical protein